MISVSGTFSCPVRPGTAEDMKRAGGGKVRPPGCGVNPGANSRASTEFLCTRDLEGREDRGAPLAGLCESSQPNLSEACRVPWGP